MTSNNAALVVHYLADFEAHNLELLPRSRVAGSWAGRVATATMGSCGASGLFGDNQYCGGAEHDHRHRAELHDGTEIIFRGADEGDSQLAAGYCEAGTFEGWCAAVRPIAQFPKVMLGIYAALTPPMLEILNSDNFITSYAGATSQGKTITLRIAASCWGCPNEKSTTSAMGTWDATRVWFGRAPAVLNHLPLVVDDTKRASRKEIIAQMIYDVARAAAGTRIESRASAQRRLPHRDDHQRRGADYQLQRGRRNPSTGVGTVGIAVWQGRCHNSPDRQPRQRRRAGSLRPRGPAVRAST